MTSATANFNFHFSLSLSLLLFYFFTLKHNIHPNFSFFFMINREIYIIVLGVILQVRLSWLTRGFKFVDPSSFSHDIRRVPRKNLELQFWLRLIVTQFNFMSIELWSAIIKTLKCFPALKKKKVVCKINIGAQERSRINLDSGPCSAWIPF